MDYATVAVVIGCILFGYLLGYVAGVGGNDDKTEA